MADPVPTPVAPARRGPRRRRVLKWGALGLIGLTVAAEIGARTVLGLGDPPLYALDPQIEYLLVPSRTYRRLGNTYKVNAYSMRADEFPPRKSSPDELRVLVIGDSIVNGGVRVDQGLIATEVLKRSLSSRLRRPVVVGNASAGSWGPPNELAWLERFGTLEADVVLVVLNSPDYEDVPGQDYIGSAWPRRTPVLALEELVGVYGWRALCKVTGWAPEPPPPARTQTRDQDIAQSHAALAAILAKARSAGAKTAVVLWPKRTEIERGLEPGWAALTTWSQEAGAPVYPTDGSVRAAMAAGQPVYIAGDIAHPEASGHALLSQTFERAVVDLISVSEPARTGSP